MSETNTTPTADAATADTVDTTAAVQPIPATDPAAAPITTDAVQTTTEVAAPTPVVVAQPVVAQPSTITDIGTRLEAAMKDLETFVSAKDSHIAMAVAAETDRIRTSAENAWQAAVTKHQGIIQSLSDELGKARTELESKLKSLVSAL